jgi:hypothetical protein
MRSAQDSKHWEINGSLEIVGSATPAASKEADESAPAEES